MVNTQLYRSYYNSYFKIHTNEQVSKSERRNCARYTGTIQNTSRKKNSTLEHLQTPVTRSEYGFVYHSIYIYMCVCICIYIYIYIYIYERDRPNKCKYLTTVFTTNASWTLHT